MTHEANRRAALHFVGQLYSARGFGDQNRWAQMQAAFDWALAELEQEEETSYAPGGWVGPVEPDQTLIPSNGLRPERTAQTADALTLARVDFLNQRHWSGTIADYQAMAATHNETDCAVRNVPQPGDGSATVPIYRFFRLRLSDRDQLWREDTRNTELCWSYWQQDEQCWFSTPAFDAAVPAIREAQDSLWSRIDTIELTELGAQVETPGDFEEKE